LPLEITFAPTRLNIHEAERVIERARSLGAFRFNTGRLMRIGTAARLWDKLEPDVTQYQRFLDVLALQQEVEGAMELCYVPFSMEEGLRGSLAEPPATLLVLPDGRVKVARRFLTFARICGGSRWRRRGKRTVVPGATNQCWRPYVARLRIQRVTRKRTSGSCYRLLASDRTEGNMSEMKIAVDAQKPSNNAATTKPATGDKPVWQTPKLEDVSEQVMAQPYIRFT
jgi:MoaA/NifB/PqqE/SkfB family radical SAM enzyme